MSKLGTASIDKITEDGIAVVTIDYFPVNALSAGLVNGVKNVMRKIEGRDPGIEQKITGIVLQGAGRTFCAGANIAAFGTKGPKPVNLGRKSSDFIGFGFEDNTLGVPVVAAIHGFALGGGLELAMACHYRVITSNAFVGLPEVNLGILPGGQGTQRLPRLVGAKNALECMLTGKHIYGPEALKMGIVDQMVSNKAELLDAAITLCRSVQNVPKHPVICEMPPPVPCDFNSFRKRMAKKRRGEIAPEAIIKCVEAACKGPWIYGRNTERGLFAPLIMSSESQSMRYMFSAERKGKRISDIPRSIRPKHINTVGIIGAGLMGGGIGMCCSNVGIKVTILDIDQNNLDRGMKLIKHNYARSRSMTAKQKAEALANFTATTDYSDLKDCDMIVEAVFESIGIKKKIFKQLDELCKPDAFLCTNTSALDIDAIASVCKPSRRPLIMGTHFFSPANVMKSLENVRGAETSDETIATMMNWGTRIGKWCILVGNCSGFVANRIFGQYSGAARVAIRQGALPEQVDAAATSFGMRMGPMAMSDLVGLDLGIQATKKAGLYRPNKIAQHALIDMGRKGQKAKAGWYDYGDDKRRGTPSPIVTNMLRKLYPLRGEVPSQEAITRSLFIPLINEGFKILEEGMAQRPSDIDVCCVYGYNFPKHRGGPMFYADQIGLSVVKSTLKDMSIKPANLLEECIAANLSLSKYWRKYGGKGWKAAKGKQHYSRVKKQSRL